MERTLQSLLSGDPFEGYAVGRIDEILLAIQNESDYDNIPHCQHEEILLAILRGESYFGAVDGRISAILASIANHTPYEEKPLSRVEGLLLEWKARRERSDS